MTENIRLFRKNALKEAFAAGQKSALGNPSNFKDMFDAGYKKGSAYLNEAINAPSFAELMVKRREYYLGNYPEDYQSWLEKNERKMCIPIIQKAFDDGDDTMDLVFVKGNKEVTLEAIEEAVESSLKIRAMVLRKNRRRFKQIKNPRYICYYLAYFHTQDELRVIGDRWGKKHHATVIHGANQVSGNAKLYPVDREILIDAYIHLIKNGYSTENIYADRGTRKSVEFVNINI